MMARQEVIACLDRLGAPEEVVLLALEGFDFRQRRELADEFLRNNGIEHVSNYKEVTR